MSKAVAATIELEYPIEFADEEITTIQLRRATGKDLKMAMKGKNDVEDALALAARLSGQLPAVFDLMDAADVTAVLDEVGKLSLRGQATG
jgi:hypothetical protein